MLRNLIFYIIFIPVTLLLSSIALVFSIFTKGGPVHHFISQIWAKMIISLSGMQVRADLSALPKDGQFIFMANHQSMVDIPIIMRALKDYKHAFVAKQSLFAIPFFGWALKRIGHISIDRSNRRKAMQSIANAQKAVQDGWSIVIFPEGTRNHDPARLMDFKIGGFVLALKCDLDVVPLVLTGTWDFVPRGTWRFKPARVTITALPPIRVKEKYTLKQREQMKDDFYEIMNAKYVEINQCLKRENP